jgi:hypothetical protein
LLAGPVLAQGAGAPAPGGGQGGLAAAGRTLGQFSVLRLTPDLEKRLALTADQKSRLDGMRSAFQQEARGLVVVGGQGGDRQEALRKFQGLAEKAENDGTAVLTPEQQKQVAAWKEDAKQYEGLGRSSLALLSVSGITDEQKEKLKKLGREMLTKRLEALKGFAPGSDRQQARQKFQEIERDCQAGIRKILNEEQDKQYEAALASVSQPGRVLRDFGGK